MVETYPLLVGGVKKHTSEVQKVRFPYTGEVYAEVCQAGNADLNRGGCRCMPGF